MEAWKRFRRYQASNVILVFIAVQLICVVCGLLFPDEFAYLSLRNIQNQLQYVPAWAIMALGVGLLMIVGEFDLSVGSTFALTSYLMAMAMNGLGIPAPICVLMALALGGCIGLMNGLIVIKTRIPSFIASLGSMMFLRGLILLISQGATQPYRPADWFQAMFTGTIAGVQAQFVWLIAVGIVTYLLLERHRFGNHIFAVGGNRETAFAIGVNPDKVKVICFVIVGVLSALAGVISATKANAISPIQGKGMELIVIAACVIGGVTLTGGSGSIIGIILGVALYFTIDNVLGLLGAGEYIELFIGIMVIVTVVVNTMTRKRD